MDLVPSSEGAYPSGYNMSYLNAKAAFIQGGSYGDVQGSIGPFVAKVDPKTPEAGLVHATGEHGARPANGTTPEPWRS